MSDGGVGVTAEHWHRWRIAEAAGPVSVGTCDCGATRECGNSEEAVAALAGRPQIWGGTGNVPRRRAAAKRTHRWKTAP